MLIFMLAGKARVGKTTLAKWLSEYAYKNGYTPVILPFAQALKDEAEKAGYSKERNPVQYREFCQTFGSTARKQDPDYWVKKFRDKVKFMYEQEQNALKEDASIWHEKVIIVDDCRYMNEVACARDLKALTIFISAGDRELIDHTADWRKHESEAMANNTEAGHKDFKDVFHYNIRNDTTERNFRSKCEEKFDEWFHIASEALVDSLCSCELCMASREDRPPDADRVIKEITELLLDIPEEEEDDY